jgi:hypothetical protein
MNHLNNVLYPRLIQGLVLWYIISSGHFDQGILMEDEKKKDNQGCSKDMAKK